MDDDRKTGTLNIDSSLYQTRISKKFEKRKAYVPADPRQILSFIPGIVVEVLVTPGANVKKGDELMIVDAMKMKNRIKCPADGVVKSIPAGVGNKVTKGSVLVVLV